MSKITVTAPTRQQAEAIASKVRQQNKANALGKLAARVGAIEELEFKRLLNRNLYRAQHQCTIVHHDAEDHDDPDSWFPLGWDCVRVILDHPSEADLVMIGTASYVHVAIRPPYVVLWDTSEPDTDQNLFVTRLDLLNDAWHARTDKIAGRAVFMGKTDIGGKPFKIFASAARVRDVDNPNVVASINVEIES